MKRIKKSKILSGRIKTGKIEKWVVELNSILPDLKSDERYIYITDNIINILPLGKYANVHNLGNEIIVSHKYRDDGFISAKSLELKDWEEIDYYPIPEDLERRWTRYFNSK